MLIYFSKLRSFVKFCLALENFSLQKAWFENYELFDLNKDG